MGLFRRQNKTENRSISILIASDIHGSAKNCRELLRAFEQENADRLLLLGDILYHGPRNPLPENYSPKEVAEMLTAYKDKIICVRGNCDSEVDQMILPFPILSDFAVIYAGGVNMFLAHGHKDVPPLNSGDVYITGHTHIPLNIFENGHLHLNPGSVSLPKDKNKTRGYILFNGSGFYFKTLDGHVYDKAEISD